MIQNPYCKAEKARANSTFRRSFNGLGYPQLHLSIAVLKEIFAGKCHRKDLIQAVKISKPRDSWNDSGVFRLLGEEFSWQVLALKRRPRNSLFGKLFLPEKIETCGPRRPESSAQDDRCLVIMKRDEVLNQMRCRN